ncbi:Uma2 family endonuclease [Pleurocapsa sp. PCC 7319]|uniref:Uma2 family endonuclease n=1 Tax=Pleurocapsa sp. PCC 7319 TaxID=118161 RepID=UPI00034B54F1|nr:Uma2 family endonuclease [Pleurocapsa sp. PCC 7319]
MVQLVRQTLSFDEFNLRYGDDSRYELIDGELIEMEPTGLHEQVAAFISRKLNVEIDRSSLDYFIPHRCLIKLLGTETAFRPDIIVLERTQLENEPLWQQEPIITFGSSIKLVIEVVSTNWQNDYARKFEDYAVLDIPEYWIVDYLGVGGREYLGKPKQPTITICTLENEEYQRHLFRDSKLLVSPTFPELQLTPKQIFDFV